MEEKKTPKVINVKPDGTEETLQAQKARKNIYRIVTGTILFLTLVGGIAAYFFFKEKPPEEVACTLEARICPDGVTAVERTGPMCEFAACPTASEKVQALPTEKPNPLVDKIIPPKTYENKEYKYSFSYAGNLVYDRSSTPEEGVIETLYFNYSRPADDENNVFIASLSSLNVNEEKANLTQDNGLYSSKPTFTTKKINNINVTIAETVISQGDDVIYRLYVVLVPIKGRTLRLISDIEDKSTVDKVLNTLQTN